MLFIGLAIAAVLFYLYVHTRNHGKREADLRKILSSWGKPSENYRNDALVGKYHEYVNPDNALSDAIATDIDFDNLFNYADRTNSKIGQQYLYHKLRSPESNVEQLLELDKLGERLCADEQIRAGIQVELLRLNQPNAYYLHQLFSSKHLPFFNWLISIYIRLAWFIWLGMVVLTIATHAQAVFILTFAITIFNFYLHYRNKKNVLSYVHSLPQLYILMQAAKVITSKIDGNDSPIKNTLQNTASLNRSLRFVNFEAVVANDQTDIFYGIWELIKTMLLIEPAMFIASIKKVTDCKDDIEALFKYVGEIDAAISIQSFRVSLPYYSKPEFIPGDGTLNVTGLYHPLVENCVPNSLTTFDNRGVLVTGSNMSGKTTFIRAMAVNALLSQTIFTSCTKKYQAPLLQLFTSIRISDDMEEHKSYFQAEAMSVLNIMDQTKNNPLKSLVIIDEIFRGTNTIERVAAAKAILSYFTTNKSFVFVSTHDLELAELLGDEYAIYCFEEQVSDTRLVFDYKIKPGILKHKNAIAIMAGLGYPESVIADAYAMSEQLRDKYKI